MKCTEELLERIQDCLDLGESILTDDMVRTLRTKPPALWKAAAPVSLCRPHSPCEWASWQSTDLYTGKSLPCSSTLNDFSKDAILSKPCQSKQKSAGSKSQPFIASVKQVEPVSQNSHVSKNADLLAGAQRSSLSTILHGEQREKPKKFPGSRGEQRSAPSNKSPEAFRPMVSSEERELKEEALYASRAEKRVEKRRAGLEKRAEELKEALYASWAEKRESEEKLERAEKMRQALEGKLASIVSERFQGVEAEEWLRTALTDNQQDLDSNLRSQLHAELAKLILRHGGDPSLVRSELVNALHHDPDNLCARIALCDLFEGPLEMKASAEKYWADLEKALLAADEHSPAAKYMLVDVAQYHERNGQPDKAQHLYAKAADVPWALRDSRMQKVPRDWHFITEPSVPNDDMRVQGTVSVADTDLMIHRPLKAPCRCRRPAECASETRKSLMIAQSLQSPSKTEKEKEKGVIQDFLVQMRTNERRKSAASEQHVRRSVAQLEQMGKPFGPDADSKRSADKHTESSLPLAPHVVREVCQMGFCTSLYGLARDSWTTTSATRSWVHQAEDVARRCCIGRRFHVNVVDVEEDPDNIDFES